jgi:hypothetical protein
LKTKKYKNSKTDKLVQHFFNSTSTAICQTKEEAAQEPAEGNLEPGIVNKMKIITSKNVVQIKNCNIYENQ